MIFPPKMSSRESRLTVALAVFPGTAEASFTPIREVDHAP